MSSELASPFEQPAERQRSARKPGRVLALEALGPLTILGGIVWAIAQPYRITFLHREGKGFYDFLVQPPLLVVIVGLVFAVAIAPGLVDDLLDADDAES